MAGTDGTDGAARPGAGLSAHPTWMEIDGGALRANLAAIRRLAGPGVRVIASIKANAYGHGAVPVARILEAAGVEMLATGSFAEASAVRAAGVSTPILMLAGALPEAMGELAAAGTVPTVYDMAGARAAAAAGTAARPVPVFVKVDTGLGRVGVGLDRAEAFAAAAGALPGLRIDGLYTHLSFKDEAGKAWAAERLDLFYALLRALRARGIEIPETQALASSALLAGWRDECTAVCPGHILYGVSPLDGVDAAARGFAPVLAAVRSRIVHLADHSGGPPPGAGGYHARRRSRRAAVIPCGYNDGCRPPAPGRTAEVLFRGRRLPAIGHSLEHLAFDVPDDVEIAVGDAVCVLGGEGPGRISLEEFAAWRDCPPLDCAMSLSARMPVRPAAAPTAP